jgi:hypothetical protein
MKVRIRNPHEDAEIMRQNARFPPSRAASGSLSGGEPITLTVRVAAASVVNGAIGHCRPSQINKLHWLYN